MHLVDCFTKTVGYVLESRDNLADRQPDFEQVKGDLQRLMSESERLCREGGFAADAFDQARFAVCAWVDETLLDSVWIWKQLWQRVQLQRIYYSTTDAGVEFFERLERLGLPDNGVREVYYLCLTLGFKGRFIGAGDDILLEQLTSANLGMLAGEAEGSALDGMELFPMAHPLQAVQEAPSRTSFRFTPVTMLAWAGPVLLCGLLYLIYSLVLGGMAAPLLN